MGDLAQLQVDDLEEPVEGVGVAFAPGEQEAGDVRSRRGRQKASTRGSLVPA
jgi:hypothetical protein